MSRKPATKQLVKRLDRAKQDLERGFQIAFDKAYKMLIDLGFGPNYAELAATDIADDYTNGLMEGEFADRPIWHEDDYQPPGGDDEDDVLEEEEEEEEEEEGEEEDE
jgi:hypothetical protein